MFDINRMGSALLSRFDLVFILLDKPDEVRDFGNFVLFSILEM